MNSRWESGARDLTIARATGAWVAWDFDGVICDSEPIQAQSYALLLSSMGNDVPEDFFQDVIGKPEYVIWKDLQKKGMHLSASIEELMRQRNAVFSETAFTQLSPSWLVKDLLDDLQGVALGQLVVSNGNASVIRALLAKWGLSHALQLDVREPSATKLDRLEQLWTWGSAVTLEDNLTIASLAHARGSWSVYVRHSMNETPTGDEVDVTVIL